MSPLAKVPFWWVVCEGIDRTHERSYLTPDGLWAPGQRQARPFLGRWKAQQVADVEQGRVVLVWGRLPEPKLPAWVKPAKLGPLELTVWRRDEAGWAEWLFKRSTSGTGARHVGVRWHRKDGVGAWAWCPFVSPDIWMEAAARTAVLLRAENRKKAGAG